MTTNLKIECEKGPIRDLVRNNEETEIEFIKKFAADRKTSFADFRPLKQDVMHSRKGPHE